MTKGIKKISTRKKEHLVAFLVFSLCFFVVGPAHAAKYNRSQNSELNSGLVGLWSFDGKDVVGGVAMDRSGNGNNGNLLNIATSTFYTRGKIGQAFNFSKTNGQGVKLGTTINAGTNFSYGSWFYSTHNGFTTGAALMGKYTSGTSFWTIQSRTGVDGDFGCTMRAGVSVSALATGVSGYMDGSWHHVMCVKSGTTLSLYIDGAFVTSTTNASMTTTTGTEATYIGDYGAANEPWSGKIDDVRLYNRALSAAEIKALYLAGSSGKSNASQNTKKTSGLVGLWSFDGKDVVSGVAMDRSGSGKNGNLINIATSTFYTTGKIGQAFNFDGSNDYTTITPAAVLQNQDFTIAFWVFPGVQGNAVNVIMDYSHSTAPSSANWVIQSEDSGAKYYLVYYDGSQFQPFGQYGSGLGVALTPGIWQHVIFTKSGTSVTGYVDGVANWSPSAASSATVSYATKNLLIGNANGYTRHFNGKLDDVRIYNRALSAAEAKALYLQGGGKVNASQNLKQTSGLVGLWSFDGKDVVNGVAVDRSGNGNNGNLINIASSTFYTVGKNGQGFLFDGTDDYISAPDSLTLSPAGDLSFSSWIKTSNSSDSMVIISKMITDNEFNPAYLFGVNVNVPGKVNLVTDSATSQVDSLTSVTDGQWHHVVGTDDGVNVKIYIDGVLDSTGGVGGSMVYQDPEPTYIGRYDSSGSYFNGVIDEVRMYNRALSAAEVKQLYNAGR